MVDYYGLTPQEIRQTNRDKFQNDDNVRYLVGTPQTGGYGITLTAANNMIYYSNGYDLEKRLQSEARIDRIGQTKPMTYIDLVAEDTIDIKIQKALFYIGNTVQKLHIKNCKNTDIKMILCPLPKSGPFLNQKY